MKSTEVPAVPPLPDRSAMSDAEHGASLAEWAFATATHDAMQRDATTRFRALYRDSILLVLVVDMMTSTAHSEEYRWAYIAKMAALLNAAERPGGEPE